ncbi:MAG: molybdopterin-binding protein [Pseudomonadota bacterium]
MNASTASLLIIGDEILSGRTQDKNISHIAAVLSQLGIDLKEVRIVSDDEVAIIEALNALRARTTYLFTTGGIGPTHDDITADCVAKSFGVEISIDQRAVDMMRERAPQMEMNEARLRMARIPHGAQLIACAASAAPGFSIGNVYVMAGVPHIMQSMLESVAPKLAGGQPFHTLTIEAGNLKEGDYATPLQAIASGFQDVMIGSYPRFTGAGYENSIVVRGRDKKSLDRAAKAVEAMLKELGLHS